MHNHDVSYKPHRLITHDTYCKRYGGYFKGTIFKVICGFINLLKLCCEDDANTLTHFNMYQVLK